jgi:hypothetical protein
MNNALIDVIKRRGIPPLGEQENSLDPIIYMEISLFQVSWRWFVTECDIQREDIMFFGFASCDFYDWGWFQLSALEKKDRRVRVYYDFEPLSFSELQKMFEI